MRCYMCLGDESSLLINNKLLIQYIVDKITQRLVLDGRTSTCYYFVELSYVPLYIHFTHAYKCNSYALIYCCISLKEVFSWQIASGS